MAIDVYFFQARITAHAMVHMSDEIAGLQFAQHAKGERLVFGEALPQSVTVKTLEDLMIRIASYFECRIDKTLANRIRNGVELHLGIEVFEDSIETLDLLGVFSKKIVLDAVFGILVQIGDEQLEMLVETGLRLGIVYDFLLKFNRLSTVCQSDYRVSFNILNDLMGPDECAVAEDFLQFFLFL